MGLRPLRAPAVLLAVLLGAPSPLAAQWVRFGRLGRDEGLSQTAVYALAQDREGFLWVGTQNGLNRYDGRTFRVDWSQGDTPSPASTGLVQTLLVDTSGRLWAGTSGQGLLRFDRANETFVPVPTDGSVLDDQLSVWDITESQQSLFLATSEGLAEIDLAAGSAVMRFMDLPAADGCGTDLRALWARPTGDLWLGTDQGCIRILDQEGRATHRTVTLGNAASVHDITPGTGDTVWTGTTAGLFLLDGSGAVVASPPELGTIGARGNVRTTLTDSHGDTWIATDGGLGALSTTDNSITWHGMSPAAQGGLPNDLVLSLLEDAGGTVWVGTWDGLARLSPYHRALRFIPSASIHPQMGGVLAFGVADQALMVGGMDGQVAFLPVGGGRSAGAIAGLERQMGAVTSIASSGESLWISTVGTGIQRRTDDGWRVYERGMNGEREVPYDRIAAVAVDRSGTVWAGTVDHGLIAYEPRVDRFLAYRGPGGDFSYAADYIWPIIEDASGALWFGANGANGGIHRLSSDRRTLTTWVTGGDPTRPNAGRVTTLELSGDTVVWFGTQGDGLGRLEVATGRTRFYDTEKGLPHPTVAGILEDPRGYLWITTEAGLVRFDPRSDDWWVLGEESGLQSNRFYFNAAFEADDGLLYFGGPNGVNVVDPTRLAPLSEPPRTVLTRFSVRGRERPEVNHLTAQSGLDLAPDNNFFAFELAALDFADVAFNEFRYRLDPLDEAWVENGSDPVANYTSVPPGRYTFGAQARRRGGAWDREGVRIPVVVRPPFYQTWWFRSSILVAVLGLTSGAYVYRRSEIEARRRLRIEARERLRSELAGELHDDIAANLSTIVQKAHLVGSAKALDQRGQSHLQDMQRLATESAHRVRETVWVVHSKYDTVSDLLKKMQDTVDTMLGGQVQHTFKKVVDEPELAVSMETRRNIYLMFKETLHNIVRHASASTVRIELVTAGGELKLRVTDDGVGFDPGSDGGGSGQDLLKRRAKLCGGSVHVQSAPGRGTTVEIRARLL